MVHAAAVHGPPRAPVHGGPTVHRAREPRSMAGPWVLPVFNGAGARLQNENCNRDFQSNCWANLRIMGQPCTTFVPGTDLEEALSAPGSPAEAGGRRPRQRSRSRILNQQFSAVFEHNMQGARRNCLSRPRLVCRGRGLSLRVPSAASSKLPAAAATGRPRSRAVRVRGRSDRFKRAIWSLSEGTPGGRGQISPAVGPGLGRIVAS
jgi:hypothetical protein